jgi:hypothetical protein
MNSMTYNQRRIESFLRTRFNAKPGVIKAVAERSTRFLSDSANLETVDRKLWCKQFKAVKAA